MRLRFTCNQHLNDQVAQNQSAHASGQTLARKGLRRVIHLMGAGHRDESP